MGPHRNEEYTLYCNVQPFNGIQELNTGDQNEPDPLDNFLNMNHMELACTLVYDYSEMVSCMISPRHGAIYRRTKKFRVRKKYINMCDRIFKERLWGGKL